MKTNKTRVLLSWLFVALMPLVANAYDFEKDGIYYAFIYQSDNAVAVTLGMSFETRGSLSGLLGDAFSGNSDKYSGEVVIPSTVTYNNTTYTVTSIANLAFAGCHKVTSIVVPESVTAIGKGAFWDCSALTSITLPEKLDILGTSSPGSNVDLEEDLECGDGSSVALSAVFYGCSSLTSIVIPEGVESIKGACFTDCASLTSVTIPTSVKSIEGMAFWRCTGLTSITIPEGVESIGSASFFECGNLTSVTIPNSMRSIGYGAFSSCTKLLNVYCHAQEVPSTGEGVFDDSIYGCATLSVPAGSLESYKTTSPWSNFYKIVSGDEAGIVVPSDACGIADIYTIDGQCNGNLRRGVNIVRMSDGTIKKVYVK